MKILHIDYETRSEVPLNGADSVGVWNYACHPSTQPLMLAYAYGDEEPKLWVCHEGPMPQELRKGLEDPLQPLSAFNSAFERYISKFKVNLDTAISRYEDPQVGARYLSMPGDLDEVSTILDLPEHLAKDKRGEELIKLFCEPQIPKKKKGKLQEPAYWADWTTHPKEWEQFKQYCKQDVVSERECARRMKLLGALPLPPFERRIWEFDQLVNDRGFPVDVNFVQKAYALATRAKKEALEQQNLITGLENANSRDQLLPWAKARGYPFNTLRKETVDSVLKDPEVKLTEECRKVLVARREASSTSYQKLSAIMRQVSPDGMLRGQFIYMGSARCGRWAGNAVQLHNMARPGVLGKTDAFAGHDFEDMAVVRDARNMVYQEDYDGIKKKYGSVLLVVKNVIRTVFVAPRSA